MGSVAHGPRPLFLRWKMRTLGMLIIALLLGHAATAVAAGLAGVTVEGSRLKVLRSEGPPVATQHKRVCPFGSCRGTRRGPRGTPKPSKGL